jgi:hypothetical protein
MRPLVLSQKERGILTSRLPNTPPMMRKTWQSSLKTGDVLVVDGIFDVDDVFDVADIDATFDGVNNSFDF